METLSKDKSILYHKAVKKANRIKGFYIHLFLYLAVNIAWFVVMAFFDLLHTYGLYGFWGMGYGHVTMAVFWGLALLLHGVLVFGQNSLCVGQFQTTCMNTSICNTKSHIFNKIYKILLCFG